MIPQIIHYCWFGGNTLPESAKKCIESWRKFLPDYEIWAWVEASPQPSPQERELNADKVMTFDVNVIPYTREAYEAKKFAFVSDYARFDILYQYGGIYFDTDVEVIKPLDDIIAKGAFMGREAGSWMKAYDRPDGLAVAPGLALGVEDGHPLYKEFLDVYKTLQFRLEDGTLNTKTICWHVTEILLKHGLTDNNEVVEQVAGVWIYPADVFCPMDHTQGNKVTLTDRTVSIHLYDCSWLDHNTMSYKLHVFKNWLMRHVGAERINIIANIIKGRR